MTDTRTPYQLVSREWQKEDTIVNVNGELIGGDNFTLIAGPCAVESREQLSTIAGFLAKKGITFLRGGAFKPRSSPYAFQGLKNEGLELLKEVGEKYNLNIVTEVLDAATIDLVADHADILQVGTRNMQNYPLLKALGKIKKPVLLKRGMSSTVEEWLLAAEYILVGGNPNVILCERGIRTFNTATRNTLDLGSLAYAKSITHLPIIADPSQGSGIRDIVVPLSKASIAAGADGIIVEVHNQPKEALSDGNQSLYFDQFDELLESMIAYSNIEKRQLFLNNPMKKESTLHNG
jgi:3-deoxy-7-phosphoheptulonate synthase